MFHSAAAFSESASCSYRGAWVSCSVSAWHLWRLLSGFGRIKEKLEGVVILILLHELEVDEPLGFPHGLTVRERASAQFQQRRGQFVFAVVDHALQCLDELLF